MASDILTYELLGEVPLEAYTDAMRHWRTVLEQLAAEVGTAAPVRWYIADLRGGSALATVRAESSDPDDLANIKHGYVTIARALRNGERIPFSERLERAALELIKPIGNGVTGVRFETADEDIAILGPSDSAGRRAGTATLPKAYGSVTGRIQTLTSRKGLAFTLFDSLFDRAVNCYLQEGQEDLVRDKWDRRARVDGLISRDPVTGRPTTIRQISDIVVLPEPGQGDFRLARGVIPFRPEAEPIGDTLRRLRDGW